VLRGEAKFKVGSCQCEKIACGDRRPGLFPTERTPDLDTRDIAGETSEKLIGKEKLFKGGEKGERGCQAPQL